MTDVPEGRILKQLNKSGLPFQLAVEHKIKTSHCQHGWIVASREQPWRGFFQDGGAGYADIVLEHSQFVTFRLVVECKRVRADDESQLHWIFLLPDLEAGYTELASCFEVEINPSRDGPAKLWDEVYLSPTSLQSEFCILHSDEPRRQSILERLSIEVLQSVEGLAEEEIMVMSSQERGRLRLFVFGAIVTNAKLAVCRFDPKHVSLKNGALDLQDLEISETPFLRFRKSLTTGFPQGKMFSNLREANRARERSVFVVNSEALVDFLKEWNIRPLSDDGKYAVQTLYK